MHIYIRDNLKVTEIMQKEPIEEFEEFWLKVQSGFHDSFIVSAIYNHPNKKNWKHPEIRRTISRHVTEKEKYSFIRRLEF